jgi:hypothetical protein
MPKILLIYVINLILYQNINIDKIMMLFLLEFRNMKINNKVN